MKTNIIFEANKKRRKITEAIKMKIPGSNKLNEKTEIKFGRSWEAEFLQQKMCDTKNDDPSILKRLYFYFLG